MRWQGGLVDIALAEHPSLRANWLMETVQDFPQTELKHNGQFVVYFTVWKETDLREDISTTTGFKIGLTLTICQSFFFFFFKNRTSKLFS